jgi:hypothetical protein
MSSTINGGLGGGFDAQLMRMMANHEIDSERENRLLIKGLHQQAQGDLAIKNAEKETANAIAGAMAWVNIGMSAVKVASQAQNVGETAKSTADLQKGVGDVQAGGGVGGTDSSSGTGSTAGTGNADDGMAALKATRLPGSGGDRVDTQLEHMVGGRQGMTVGERFTDQQLGVITGKTDLQSLSNEDLKGMGFSDREVATLRHYGSDGLSGDEGVHFMMTHSSPESRFGASQMEVITRDGPITETDAQLREKGFTDPEIADLRRLSADGTMSNADTKQFLDQHGAQKADPKEMVKAALMKALTETLPERVVTVSQEKAQKTAKEMDANKEIALETAGKLRDDISKFAESLQQMELQKLERAGGVLNAKK